MLRKLTALDSKTLLGRLVRMPLRLIPRSSVVSVKRGVNKGSQWIVGSAIHRCWIGTYEFEMQELVSRLIRPGMVVWDVGANAGFYTLAFARLVGDAGRVYAFEPFAENVDNLLKHVRLNRLSNAVVVQAALGASTGISGFETAVLNAEGRISNQETSYLVPTFTVDEFLTNSPGARPDLLKIDVEGAEADLLSGATQLLRRSTPDLLLALHGPVQAQRCVEFLISLGYSLFYLDGSPVGETLPKSNEIYARRDRTSESRSADSLTSAM